MNTIVRSLIAAAAAVVSSAVFTLPANAAITSDHSAWSGTALGKTGFLGYKSFLIGPSGRDEPGIALEGMRIISPATIFSATRSYQQKLLPPELFRPLDYSPPPLPEPLPAAASDDMDSARIPIKGVPTTISMGLKQALREDLKQHVDLYGVSGLTSPSTGFASAAYLQAATRDLITNIGLLEQMPLNREVFEAAPLLSRRTYGLREPPTILMFLTGLFFLVLLRGDRLQAKPAA